MSAIQNQVQAASEAYSSSFTQGSLALPPAKKYLVLTCMDARIDPARAFGIDLGDAHVIRNVSNTSLNLVSSVLNLSRRPERLLTTLSAPLSSLSNSSALRRLSW